MARRCRWASAGVLARRASPPIVLAARRSCEPPCFPSAGRSNMSGGQRARSTLDSLLGPELVQEAQADVQRDDSPMFGASVASPTTADRACLGGLLGVIDQLSVVAGGCCGRRAVRSYRMERLRVLFGRLRFRRRPPTGPLTTAETTAA